LDDQGRSYVIISNFPNGGHRVQKLLLGLGLVAALV